MKARTMRVILPTIALVLIAGTVAAYVVVRTETATPPPMANWTTFHDYFGLFTIRYPESWTVDGGDASGAERFPARDGGNYFLYEKYLFTEPGHPNYQLEIDATEIANSGEHAYFCSDVSPNEYKYTNSTLAGMPAYRRATWGYVYFGFGTGNGMFTISLGMPPTDALVLATPTPLPETQIKDVYNPILATFKPSSSKRFTC